MVTKILLIPAVLLGLYLAYYLFSTLLLLFPGSSRLTGRKLRIGTLILSLTLFAFPGGRVYVEGTCYDREIPVMEISTEGSVLVTTYDPPGEKNKYPMAVFENVNPVEIQLVCWPGIEGTYSYLLKNGQLAVDSGIFGTELFDENNQAVLEFNRELFGDSVLIFELYEGDITPALEMMDFSGYRMIESLAIKVIQE